MSIIAAVFWAAALSSGEVAPAAYFIPNEELGRYIDEALTNNPAVKSAYLAWEAALQRVPQVTALDDPMFTYTQFLQSDQKRFGVSLEQKFPWFGTLRARGNQALAESDAALSQFYALRNETVAALKRAYFEYGLIGKNLQIVESQAKLLAEAEELVKSRYALGLANQADLYRVQIEKDQLDDMGKGLSQSQSALSAQLTEQMGRDAGSDVLPWPGAAALPPAPPEEPVVLARIRAVNPEISAVQHMVDRWEQEVVLARKRGYPEFSLGLGYDNMKDMQTANAKMNRVTAVDGVKMYLEDAPMKGVLPTLGNIAYEAGKNRYLRESNEVDDDVMVSLRFSLPVWRKRIRAGIEEARLMQSSVENDQRRVALRLDSAARTALYNLRDAQRRYNLYQEVLIPKEQQAYENLQSYYAEGTDPFASGGSADYLDIQNSLKTLLEFQLEQARAARDWQNAAADLELLMGGFWGETGVSQDASAPESAAQSPTVKEASGQ